MTVYNSIEDRPHYLLRKLFCYPVATDNFIEQLKIFLVRGVTYLATFDQFHHNAVMAFVLIHGFDSHDVGMVKLG